MLPLPVIIKFYMLTFLLIDSISGFIRIYLEITNPIFNIGYWIRGPILFLFKPEFIHDFSFYSIKIIFKIPLIKYLFKKLFVLENKNLEINVIGKKFKNRIGLAAGFDKNGELLNQIEYFGFFVVYLF